MHEEKIIAIVRNRFADYQFTVEKLAEEAGIGVSHLREKVHLYYKMCPQELIETVRLENALRLLCKNHAQSLYDVIPQCGYRYERTFLDAFEKRLGATPTVCRNALCANEARLKNWIEKLWMNGLNGLPTEEHFGS